MGMFTVGFDAVAITAQQDLIALATASQKPIWIHEIQIFQTSDFGDAQDEILPVVVKRGATTVGSGGSSATPVATDGGSASSGVTARVNDTTIASGGTIVSLPRLPFNVRAGLIWVPTPSCQIYVVGSSRIVVGLTGTPADSLTCSGFMTYEELGS